ncbi:AAA family ATPase [Mucilaginibacter sp. 21P]|uniref:ATP-binding protein n=1 Tax=Mucilaginibacter sp. 21P TaxID=2778902 RepID=UPI001C58AEDA|nr:ATP-binding protein [Mucilaginibacter sp. 21P]QXV65867.1 AAA family ATPase [Mucilaginibacter sp. 21P]
MFNNIAFVGGIHGVGKSTMCKRICADLNINYLSASDVLQWANIKLNHKDKKVDDIGLTQDRLINGLRDVIDLDEYYLLDGHFCLLNKNNEIFNIPIETFKAIDPTSLTVVIGVIEDIKDRLETRDKIQYSISLLQDMQNSEVEHATTLSKLLKKPITIGSQNDYLSMLTAIKVSLKGKL